MLKRKYVVKCNSIAVLQSAMQAVYAVQKHLHMLYVDKVKVVSVQRSVSMQFVLFYLCLISLGFMLKNMKAGSRDFFLFQRSLIMHIVF